MTEEMVADLPRYRESKLFTPREKAAIRYAEVLASEEFANNTTLYDELREHFTDREIIDLGWRIALVVGLGRWFHTLGFAEVCELPPRETKPSVQPSK